MSQGQQRPNRSIVNWLGLGALLLLVVGLVRLSSGNRPPAELPQPSPSPLTAGDLASPTLPAADLNSPLPASLTSPLPADLNSPLPTPAVTLPPAPPSPANADGFQLTVLHTNDTWGYLLPCG